MSDALLSAILAMDAYNRGCGAGITGVTQQIGTATVFKDALDETLLPTGAAEANGFYAVVYSLSDGTTVISYRGTDNASIATPTT